MTVNSAKLLVTEPFTARLRRLREDASLTQSALATPRYTVSYVSQIESGRRVPSHEVLTQFAERLGVSVAYLETGVPDDLEEQLAYGIEEARAAIRQGELAQALEVARGVIEESERYSLRSPRARALVVAADALLLLGRAREAIDRYEEALEDGLSERERGLAVAQVAIAYRAVGDLSYAAELIESALRTFRTTPLDPGVSAELHSVLLSVYFERGDVTKAERVAQQALSAAREGVSPQTRSNVLWAASRVFAEAKRWDEALELATESRLIIEGLNDRARLARVHTAYAYLCLEVDPPRLADAGRHLDEAESLLGPNGPTRDLTHVYTEQGRLALLSGRPDEALAQSERALRDVADNPLERSRCLYLRGRALGELGRTDDALNDFLEAAASFEKVGARQQVASCYREVGEIEFRDGDLESAVEAFRAGLEALEPRRSRA